VTRETRAPAPNSPIIDSTAEGQSTVTPNRYGTSGTRAPRAKARNDEPAASHGLGSSPGARPISSRAWTSSAASGLRPSCIATASASSRSTPRRTQIWASSLASPSALRRSSMRSFSNSCSASSAWLATEVASPPSARFRETGQDDAGGPGSSVRATRDTAISAKSDQAVRARPGRSHPPVTSRWWSGGIVPVTGRRWRRPGARRRGAALLPRVPSAARSSRVRPAAASEPRPTADRAPGLAAGTQAR
jgi:hypothetical protein